MAVATPAIIAIVNAYNRRVAATRKAAVDRVAASWDRLGSYRSADINGFVRSVVPVVEGAQIQVARLTDAYLAEVEANVLGTTVRPLGIPRATVLDSAMRGVSTAEVYGRAGPTVWSSLANGNSLDWAARTARARMVKTAETDIQLAKTHSSRSIFSRKSHVVGHRRVLRGAGSCVLCAVASTQRYHKDQLQPIHPGCDCGVEPIFGDKDPGRVVDPERLASVQESLRERFGHDDARRSASTGGRATKVTDFDDARQLVVTHEHGEIGPVLGIRGQTFTGPDDI